MVHLRFWDSDNESRLTRRPKPQSRNQLCYRWWMTLDPYAGETSRARAEAKHFGEQLHSNSIYWKSQDIKGHTDSKLTWQRKIIRNITWAKRWNSFSGHKEEKIIQKVPCIALQVGTTRQNGRGMYETWVDRITKAILTIKRNNILGWSIAQASSRLQLCSSCKKMASLM